MIKRALTMLAFATLAGGLGLGCKDEGPLPKVDCNMVSTVPKYSELTILKVCNQCHASTLSGKNRYDAPNDVNYDVFAAAKAKAEDGAREVNGGDMPPSDADKDLAEVGGLDHTISAEEKTAFYQWALCGTPQ
jgi:hypothetical protein